jgi:hypothetical protein
MQKAGQTCACRTLNCSSFHHVAMYYSSHTVCSAKIPKQESKIKHQKIKINRDLPANWRYMKTKCRCLQIALVAYQSRTFVSSTWLKQASLPMWMTTVHILSYTRMVGGWEVQCCPCQHAEHICWGIFVHVCCWQSSWSNICCVIWYVDDIQFFFTGKDVWLAALQHLGSAMQWIPRSRISAQSQWKSPMLNCVQRCSMCSPKVDPNWAYFSAKMRL